jgi:hypothetical protein
MPAARQPAPSRGEEGHRYSRRNRRQSDIDRQESPAHEELSAEEADDRADDCAANQQHDNLRSRSRAEVLRQKGDRDARHNRNYLLHLIFSFLSSSQNALILESNDEFTMNPW